MTVDTVAASPSPEGGAALPVAPPTGPERNRARARRRHAADIEAATEALHEAAIYFEAGHYLTFTGSQVAAILADRITALDEAYLADIARPQTRMTE